MDAQKYIDRDPAVRRMADLEETAWINPRFLPFDMTDAVCQLVVSDEDIQDAADRLQRFAPFIAKCFPETAESGGIIESPLAAIPHRLKIGRDDAPSRSPSALAVTADAPSSRVSSSAARTISSLVNLHLGGMFCPSVYKTNVMQYLF